MGKLLELDGLAYGVLAFTLVIVSQSPGTVSGQEQYPYQKYSDYPTQKNDRSAPREGPEETPPAEDIGALQETGFYQAGPRTGAFQGASRAFGIGGGGITLPELRLKLPSIELPCLTHFRHSAKMRYEGGEAPWISTGFQAVGREGVAQRSAASRSGESDEGSRDADGGKSRDFGDDNCEDVRREYERKIDKLNEKLESCDRLEKDLQDAIRKHHAGLSRVPFLPSQDVGIGLQRLPMNSLPASHFEAAPPSQESPTNTSSRRTPSVQPASHLGLEPALLPSIPRMQRLPQAKSYPFVSRSDSRYPATGY